MASRSFSLSLIFLPFNDLESWEGLESLLRNERLVHRQEISNKHTISVDLSLAFSASTDLNFSVRLSISCSSVSEFRCPRQDTDALI
jgi:hypothetical protein